MIRPIRAGFVCFGEVNTPAEVIERKRDQALSDLKPLDLQLTDAGIVSDDSEYKTADLALSKLRGEELDVLIVCVAGWIPSHAVVRVTDPLRHLPILLWGLCGWMEGEKLVTTADHDDRVVPAHSFKFAATLQAAQGCDRPVLIRIDTAAGHGLGKSTAKRIDEQADVLVFLFRNTGTEVK